MDSTVAMPRDDVVRSDRGRPLLIVDIDGVLNPDMPRDNPEPPWITFVAQWSGYVVALNPEHGKELLAIAERTGCELVWGTTWEEHANDEVASRLGLPALPVVHVTTPPEVLDSWVIWKSGHIAKYAAGRPFVWLDDHPSELDSRYLAANGAPDHLIVQIDPETGLEDHHLRQAEEWLESCSAGDRNGARFVAARLPARASGRRAADSVTQGPQ